MPRPQGLAWGVYERLRGRGLVLANDNCGVVTGAFIAVESSDPTVASFYGEALAWVLRWLLEEGSGDPRLGGGLRHTAVYTSEPTLGPAGFLLRQAERGGPGEEMRLPQLLALLSAADRVYHLAVEGMTVPGCRGIAGCLGPAHQPPVAVVTSGYKYSAIAVAASAVWVDGRMLPGVSVDWVKQVNAYAPPPHILVYLDSEPEPGERWGRQPRNGVDPAEVYMNLRGIVEGLRRSGEATLVVGSRGVDIRPAPGWPPPLWLSYLPLCVYPVEGPYPLVVEVEPRGAPETLRSLVEGVIDAMMRLRLARKPLEAEPI